MCKKSEKQGPEAKQKPCRVEIIEFDWSEVREAPCMVLSRVAGPLDGPVLQMARCGKEDCPAWVVDPSAEPGIVPARMTCAFLTPDVLLRGVVNNTAVIARAFGARPQPAPGLPT